MLTDNCLKKIIGDIMNLRNAQEGKVYIVSRIDTDDDELNSFLFSLGCYAGEPITVVSRRKSSCVVSIKDGRYNIDLDLAEAIVVE
jgi:ferrous iron transport protein A